MNKTIKQAERYEAPEIKAMAVATRQCIATSGQLNDWQEEDVTGSWQIEE